MCCRDVAQPAAASGCVSGGEVYTAHQTTTACGSGICLLFYLMSGVLRTPHSLFTPAPLAIVSPRAETGAAGALAPPADRGGGATRMHLLRQWLPSAASGQEALGRAAHQDVHAGWQRDRGGPGHKHQTQAWSTPHASSSSLTRASRTGEHGRGCTMHGNLVEWQCIRLLGLCT